MRRSISLIALVLACVTSTVFAQNLTGKKVLLIDSYHEGYEWSDGIVRGLKNGLTGSGIVLDILRLDTKNNPGEDFKKQAGLKAKAYIEQTKPDLVVAADDNAANYIIVPFFKNSSIPFISVGVNWDASAYGFPYKNLTAMIEVSLVSQLIANMKDYAKGDRLGFITGDSETERKELKYYKQLFNIPFTSEKLVKTFAEWKTEYRKMAGSVDMIFFGNNAAIKDWDAKEAADWIAQYTKIPSGTINDYMMPFTMVGMAKLSDEFGVWSAQTAKKILAGASPADIPMVKNEQTKLMLNVALATKAGIVFKPALLKNATIVK